MLCAMAYGSSNYPIYDVITARCCQKRLSGRYATSPLVHEDLQVIKCLQGWICASGWLEVRHPPPQAARRLQHGHLQQHMQLCMHPGSALFPFSIRSAGPASPRHLRDRKQPAICERDRLCSAFTSVLSSRSALQINRCLICDDIGPFSATLERTKEQLWWRVPEPASSHRDPRHARATRQAAAPEGPQHLPAIPEPPACAQPEPAPQLLLTALHTYICTLQ